MAWLVDHIRRNPTVQRIWRVLQARLVLGAGYGVAVALTAISIMLNCSFALLHQRLTTGAPPEKVTEFRQWQSRIDGYFHPRSGAEL